MIDISSSLYNYMKQFGIRDSIKLMQIPTRKTLSNYASNEMNNILGRISSDVIEYKEEYSMSRFSSILNRITRWASSLNSTVGDILKDMANQTSDLIYLNNKILGDSEAMENDAVAAVTDSCIFFDNYADAVQKKTTAMSLYEFIVLPFLFHNNLIYTSSLSLTVNTTESILFSDLSNISSLPIKNQKASIKYKPSNQQSTFTFAASGISATSNLIYIKLEGQIKSIAIALYSNGGLVYNASQNGKYALFNFPTATFNRLLITVTTTQLNTQKNESLQLLKLIIFNEVLFIPKATFESVNKMLIRDNRYTTKTALHYTKSDSTTNTHISSYVSYATAGISKFFSSVTPGEYLPSQNLSFLKTLYMTRNRTENYDLNVVTYTNESIVAKYRSLGITESDYRDTEYKKTLILGGCNTAYGIYSGDVSSKYNGNDVYENWSKVGNVYKTTLLNWEDDVYVNIGNSELKINGKIVSGKINIPKGLCELEVHESYIDFTFGRDEQDYNINKWSNILGDDMFPFNFAYRLTGLPLYKADGLMNEARVYYKRKENDKIFINGSVEIQLPDSCFPFSVRIINSNGVNYTQHFGDRPYSPYTFTVQPYNGKIIICSGDTVQGRVQNTDEITISYIPTQSDYKPCGIFFNRRLYYIDIKTLISSISRYNMVDQTWFTLTATESGLRKLLISDYEYRSGYYAFNNHILRNSRSADIYTSVKFDLESTNMTLTPIISRISVEAS